MDPSNRLDHAVFHLTPTRTRCDLLVCSGKGAYEKIASGLLEPFLSHLRCAKEQIPKGGYSFTLRPPAAAATGRAAGDVAAASPPWFTKGTLERFVRFVRTPDTLERVTAIEKEIVHIESCFHPAAHEEEESSSTAATAQDTPANGTGKAEQQGSASRDSSGEDHSRNMTSPPKLKVEANGHDAAQGENSKLCLQQILETRRAVLLKEQGMAYARAAVAGYEMASIDDLVSFADAFGASRLREACVNFKDLCKKKEKDKIWMDELAAMETCQHSELSCTGTSAITLTNDHPELNGTFGDAVTNATIAISSSNAGQDNNGQTPYREPWTPASNGIYQEKPQIPAVGWPSHPSPYMYNLQNPAQQMPPYQAYAFSGLVPPYYLGQFDSEQQSPCVEPSDHGNGYSYQRSHMSSSSNHAKPVKTKATRSTRTTSGEKEGETSHASSESGSASDGQVHYEDSPQQKVLEKGWGHKRSNKKSSRTVVIRNINYISSERRNGEDGSTDGSSVEGDINGDFLKQKVDNIVDSLEKYHKTSNRQHKKKGKNRNHRNIHTDDDSTNKNVETDANGKVCSDIKGDESWHAFKSILMRDESSSTELHGENSIIPSKSNVHRQVFSGDDSCIISSPNLEAPLGHNFPLEAESPKGIRQRLVATDPIAASAKDDTYEGKGSSEIFDCDENYTAGMKRSNAHEELLFSERSKSDCVTPDDVAIYGNELVIPNSQRDGDWFIVPKSRSLQDGKPTAEHSIFEGDRPLKSSNGASNEKTRNEVLIDDSFIVVTRSTADEHPISQWETDISIISGLAFPTEADVQPSNQSTEHSRQPDNHEPDDLQMVLERSSEIEPVGATWTPELDYTVDIAYNIVENFDSVLDANGSTDVHKPPTSKGAINEVNPRNKLPGKDVKSRSLHGPPTKAKSEVMSRNKKLSAISREAIQRNKMLKEEENRKRMEDLLAQRQKRIAERSSNSSTSSFMSKVSSTESKLGRISSRNEKKAPQSAIQGNNKSSVLTGSYKFGQDSCT